MRTTITAITFPYFLTDKERYNPLDYFRMGIIEERTKGVVRIQLSIHDGAFLQKQLKANWSLIIFAKALHGRCSIGF